MVVCKGLKVSNGKGLFKLGKREFPCRLVARTPAFTAEGGGLISGWGTKIPHAKTKSSHAQTKDPHAATKTEEPACCN